MSECCGLFLHVFSFRTADTICNGGNASGKTTLLNVIAQKLGIQRISLFNRSGRLSAIDSAVFVALGHNSRLSAINSAVFMALGLKN